MSTPEADQDAEKKSLIDGFMERMLNTISGIDDEAVLQQVEKQRKLAPNLSADELAEKLIQLKCMQTGAVGAVTSGTAVLPGLGTIASLTFGVAADIGMTLKMQAELVLEIAHVYERQLDDNERRNAVLLVGGFNTGTNRLLNKAGQEIAEKASQRLASKAMEKAIPLLGVAASAGVNSISTYIIGRRAQAYFKLGPQAMQDSAASLRAISGIDEQKIAAWLAETTERSWKLASTRLQNISEAVIVAGKSAGELIVVNAAKAGEAISGAHKAVTAGARTAAAGAVELGRTADTRLGTSPNPLVRFFGRYIGFTTRQNERNLRWIFSIIKRIGAFLRRLFSKPVKKSLSPPEIPLESATSPRKKK